VEVEFLVDNAPSQFFGARQLFPALGQCAAVNQRLFEGAFSGPPAEFKGKPWIILKLCHIFRFYPSQNSRRFSVAYS
jgi:hypothetical protein